MYVTFDDGKIRNICSLHNHFMEKYPTLFYFLYKMWRQNSHIEGFSDRRSCVGKRHTPR